MNTNQALDRVGGVFRSATRRAGRAGRGVVSLESEMFRPADSPKSTVSVTVVDAVVELRCEVKNPETRKRLEAEARSIPEARDVRHLLHLPKTPAPGRADSPGSQRAKSP